MEKIIGTSLDYTNTVASNFPHRTKLWEFLPMGSFNGTIGSSDIIRFNIKSDEFWDSYSTFIEISIDVSQNAYIANDAVLTNKLLQLDSSAQSFFQTLVIYDNNEELERIMQYDTLACMLKDITSDTSDRYAKDYEGLGGCYNTSFYSTVSSTAQAPRVNDTLYKSLKFWQPNDNQFIYQDANNALALGSNNGLFYTTANHVANNTQSAFVPYANRVATTYAGAGNVLEWCNDFSYQWPTGYLQPTPPNTDPLVVGIPNAYNPAFGCNGFEPIFSSVVPQRYMSQGLVRAGQITTATFQVPLMSAIFGALLPLNCYKLIPIKYFRDLVFEFTMNPYALFTSFFSTTVAARSYIVKSLKIKTELVNIQDRDMLNAIDALYSAGIKIPTQQWSMGPLYPISNGQVPPTLQVNLGFESLRDILFCFLPNDYTANSGCRKQYRLSMNITSLQIKVGTEYYPQLAIQGNGGNNLGTVVNNEFIKHLMKSFGKHIGYSPSGINPHNFAINCRAFDPNTTDTLFTGNAQIGHFEENRVIGKAVYSLNLDALNYDNRMLSGLSTTNAKPFEILLGYDSSKPFPRACTMFTFFRHDCLLLIGPDGNRVFGRN